MYRKPEESALPVARLRGMSDLTGLTLQRSYRLQRVLISLLDSFGYLPLETPLLEATELFLRKSGGELASQLLSFNDPLGRAVSLRPEFTAPRYDTTWNTPRTLTCRRGGVTAGLCSGSVA